MPLPTDSAARKRIPLFSGVVAYFPDALAGVAAVSWEGNEKHNPGEALHWAREKSTDHEDCIARHTQDALQAKTLREKVQHLRSRSWRALAAQQLAEEALIAEEQAMVEEQFLDAHAPPIFCFDCGVDLRERYHTSACLRGLGPRVG